MRVPIRFIGIVLGALLVFTACNTLFSGEQPPRISSFVSNGSGLGNQPTVLPSVTPANGPIGASDSHAFPSTTNATPEGLSAVLSPALGSNLDPNLRSIVLEMDEYLRSLNGQGYFSGAALVAYKGQIILNQGYGLANYEQAIQATPQTRFRLASVSKPLTSLAIMKLVGEGKLNLQASICIYLEDCPAAWGAITIHHLLSHTSGIPNYTDFLSFADVETSPVALAQLVARFRDLPLGFAPGELYQYCNSNYVLLGEIIEQVTGQSYADYMRDNLFWPLGMSNSGYDQGDATVLLGTRGYAGAGVPAIALDTSNLFAAGGLYSSAEDLYKLAQALDAGTLIPSQQASAMYTPYMFGYGYGWKIENRFNRPVIYHPGLMSGAATYFGRYPSDALTVILLSNNEYTNTVATADYLAGLILDR